MENVSFHRAAGVLLVGLCGEIDHHAAQQLRARIDDRIEIEQPQKLVLDFAAVTFMDSSGVGLILGRMRRMQENGGELLVQHPPQPVQKLLQLAHIAYLT